MATHIIPANLIEAAGIDVHDSESFAIIAELGAERDYIKDPSTGRYVRDEAGQFVPNGVVECDRRSTYYPIIQRLQRIIDAKTSPAAAAAGGRLATERQVDYIMSLLASRERSGEAGGFMTGPTTRDGVHGLTTQQASSYITSLTGRY